MNTKYSKWVFFITLLFSGLFFLSGGSVHAASCPTNQADIANSTGKFGARNTIIMTVGGVDYAFVDGNVGDNSNSWTLSPGIAGCFGEIKSPDAYNIPVSASGTYAVSLDMDFHPLNGAQTNTNPATFSKNIEASKANIYFYWASSTEIKSLVDSGWGTSYKQATTPAGVSNRLFVGTESKCADLLVVSADNKTAHFYKLENNNNTGNDTLAFVNTTDANIMRPWFPDSCEVMSTYNDARTGFLRDSANKITSPNYALGAVASASVSAGGGGAAGTEAATCENRSVDFDIRWLMCPILSVVDKAITQLDDGIQTLLVVDDPNNASDIGSVNKTALHSAWGKMRNLALFILIPIMLVMVIGTALGVSFLDAYTVRRAMPRFLIAIVFISVSWYITSFLINLTNIVGVGILGIMTGSFGGSDQTLSSLINPDAGSSVALGISGLAITGGLILAGAVSFGIIVSYAFVAALVLLAGFVLLQVRQLLILTLVLLAPIAILSWIFPNNDKLWKLWWGTFSKLLLMYPMIMILIGGGRIFAFVIASS